MIRIPGKLLTVILRETLIPDLRGQEATTRKHQATLTLRVAVRIRVPAAEILTSAVAEVAIPEVEASTLVAVETLAADLTLVAGISEEDFSRQLSALSN